MAAGDGFGDEISNLDFYQIIGGPLKAAVKGQQDAAMTTIGFLQDVCLTRNGDADAWVTTHVYNRGAVVKTGTAPSFVYHRALEKHTSSAAFNTDILKWESGLEEDGLVATSIMFGYEKKDAGITTTHALAVPLMTMVPIPYIRIEEMNLEFNMKLNSVQKDTREMKTALGVSVGVRAFGGRVRLSAGYSRKSSRSDTSSVDRSYSMNVKVRVVQAEIPAGIERMINILDQLITDEAAV